jgi:tetratricopeptide (TPR) repeat protein
MRTFFYVLTWTLLTTFYTLKAQDNKAQKLFEAQKYTELRTYLAESKSAETVQKLWEGRIALAEKKYNEAIELLESVTELSPSNTDGHFWLGTSYAQKATQGNLMQKATLAPKIRTSFERVLELSPNNMEAMKILVEFYNQAPSFMGGSPEKALTMAQRIKVINKVAGCVALAELYTDQKQLPKAIKEYQEALSVEPNNFSLAFMLGSFYLKNKQYTEAFGHYEAFLKKNPNNMQAIYQIGKLAAISGQNLTKGEENLLSYIRSHKPAKEEPSHASAIMRLGMIYEKKGSIPEAKKYYQASLKLDPNIKEAKEGLERL